LLVVLVGAHSISRNCHGATELDVRELLDMPDLKSLVMVEDRINHALITVVLKTRAPTGHTGP